MHRPEGTGEWFGWANAVISELTATASGLEVRRRKRNGQRTVYPTIVLIASAILSVAAQIAVAKPHPTGRLIAAIPALAFLALTKLVLSRTPTTEPATPQPATAPEPDPETTPQPAVTPLGHERQDHEHTDHRTLQERSPALPVLHLPTPALEGQHLPMFTKLDIASALALTPGTASLVPGVGANTEPHLFSPFAHEPSQYIRTALERAARPDYPAWLRHVESAASCTQPIRLHGNLATVDARTGEILAHRHTSTLPDGVIYKACGNRRRTVSPACATTCQHDAYHLVRAGLVGGNTIPDSVCTHPAVFATLTIGYTPAGKRITRKAAGRTKTEAKAKLKEAIRDLDDGLTPAAGHDTVANAVPDWLTFGLSGRDPKTIETKRILAETHITPQLGARKLRELSADDVDRWLAERAKHVSTRPLQELRSILKRAITRAQARDKVKRNVVLLCELPKGKPGRPSKSLTFTQAEAVLTGAEHARPWLWAYVALLLLTGARTEELRELAWSHVVAYDKERQEWRSVIEVGWEPGPRRGIGNSLSVPFVA
ncbi:replication initiator [Nonomuraea sp. 3N208]|uniref:replication initiator n=1 Tax=Nonomuraea sp. 3N208 TaxID=3457421 RepID=UPI003FD09B18